MMANDKDFIIKNALEVGKDTKVTLGTVTSNNVNLSTGNYFADTPSGTSTYTFSNPGDVQAFQLELTGGTAEVASVFSTTLYTGTNDGNPANENQTITNGIDLAGEGGLVWIKRRDTTGSNFFHDSERAATTRYLISNGTNAEANDNGSVTSFNSDGFTVGNWIENSENATYASWTFRKAAGFFDVVTWTGNGVAGREIAHNLGTTVGSIIVKAYNVSGENWTVYHRGLNVNGDNAPETDGIYLNLTNAAFDEAGFWYDTAPTDTNFTVGANLNSSFGGGMQFVAYLFAHDTAADGLIQCGSYTGTSSSVDINLGWEPQWLLIKRSDNIEDWSVVDNVRGMGTDPLLAGLKALTPNTSSAEESPAYSPIVPSSTGFTAHTGYDARYCANGGTYIYIAIRAASDPDITWPASVEWTGGTAPSSPAVGETDVYTFVTDDGGTTYTGIQSADNLS